MLRPTSCASLHLELPVYFLGFLLADLKTEIFHLFWIFMQGERCGSKFILLLTAVKGIPQSFHEKAESIPSTPLQHPTTWTWENQTLWHLLPGWRSDSISKPVPQRCAHSLCLLLLLSHKHRSWTSPLWLWDESKTVEAWSTGGRSGSVTEAMPWWLQI